MGEVKRARGTTQKKPPTTYPRSLNRPYHRPRFGQAAGVVSRTPAARSEGRRADNARRGSGRARTAPARRWSAGRAQPASPSGRAPSPGARAGCATPPKGRFASPWRPPGAPSPVLLAGELPLNGETEKGTRAHPGPPKQQGRWRLPSFALAHGADCLKSESKMEADADVFAVHSRASGNPVYE